MPQMGKLYLGDIDVTFMYMGEQCVYELVTEAGSASTVTFNFTDSSLASTIYVMDSNGTLITALTSAPYVYSAATGGSIKWSASTSNAGNYYKAEGSVALMGNRTVNVNMLPYYTVTFNWITPDSGSENVSSYGNEWYIGGRYRYKSGATVNWNVSAPDYSPDWGSFAISANTTINVELTLTGYSYQPLTFQCVSAGTLTWNVDSVNPARTISYSLDDGNTWTDITSTLNGATITTLAPGQTVKVKGTNTNYNGNEFGGTAKYNLRGSLGSLVNGDYFSSTTADIGSEACAFMYFFADCNVISAGDMTIPFSTAPSSGFYGMFLRCSGMTTVPQCRVSSFSGNSVGCYARMFEGCKAIRTALPMPIRTLVPSCYENMYKGCTSLITVGGLSASTLQQDCYKGMFSGCTSLSATPLMSASTIATNATGVCMNMFAGCSNLTNVTVPNIATLRDSCYDGMFSYCTSLTSVPSLPATTLARRCYMRMFMGCTSVTTVSSSLLPVTALSESCYEGMFADCTALTTPPSLPSTAMAVSCYAYMFSGCHALTSTPTLSSTQLANSCYQGMFVECTSLTTTTTLPASTLAASCYTEMFYYCTGLTSAPSLMASTLANGCYIEMFAGCNKLTSITVYATTNNTTANTENWVDGITTTGTLYVAQGQSSNWPTGSSRRPINWTVSSPQTYYTQTFCVYPSAQEWGDGATFAVDGLVLTCTGQSTYGGKTYDNYSYSAPAGTSIRWTLSDDLGQPQNGSLTIVGNNTMYITHKVQYAITSVTPSDAAIVLNTVATSSTIVDYSSAVTWSVSRSGYMTQSGTTAITQNVNTAVTLAPIYNITFHISRQDTASYASNAAIYVDDVYIGVTNSVGELSYTGYSGQSLLYTITKDGFSDYDGFTTISGNNQTIYATLIPTVTYSYSITTVQSGCTVEIAGNRLTGSSIAGGTYTYTSQTPVSVSYRVTKQYCDAETGTLTTNQSKTIALSGLYYVNVKPYAAAVSGVVSDQYDDIFDAYSGPDPGGPDADNPEWWSFGYKYKPERQVQMAFGAPGYNEYPYTFTSTSPLGEDSADEITLTPAAPDYSKQYLTFEVVSAGTITFKLNSGAATYRKTIEYSSDNGNTWNSVTSTTGGTGLGGNWSAGTKILIRGNNIRYTQNNSSYYNTRYNFFGGTASIKMYGNIMSLVSGASYESATGTLATYAFVYLFHGFTGITDAGNLVLPASPSNLCYYGMFYQCSNLTAAPKLPATTLANSCYYRMFYGCFNLVTAPDLPAPTLVSGCCYQMFYGCTSLNYIKCLATSISATNSHYQWVYSVNTSGTFVKASSITESTWGRGNSGIPTNWTVENA